VVLAGFSETCHFAVRPPTRQNVQGNQLSRLLGDASAVAVEILNTPHGLILMSSNVVFGPLVGRGRGRRQEVQVEYVRTVGQVWRN
jgi:hypothetical protein